LTALHEKIDAGIEKLIGKVKGMFKPKDKKKPGASDAPGAQQSASAEGAAGGQATNATSTGATAPNGGNSNGAAVTGQSQTSASKSAESAKTNAGSEATANGTVTLATPRLTMRDKEFGAISVTATGSARVKSGTDKALDASQQSQARASLNTSLGAAVARKAAAIGVTGLAAHYSEIAADAKASGSGNLSGAGIVVQSVSVTSVDLPAEVKAAMDAAAASKTVGQEMSFSAAGESHRIWIDNKGGNATVMMASTPAPLSSTLAGLRGQAQRHADKAVQTKALSLIGQAEGLLASTDAAADSAIQKKAASSPDVVSKEASLVSLMRQILGTLWTRTEALDEAIDSGATDNEKLENARKLGDYAMAMGKDPAKMSDEEKTAILKGHSLLLNQRVPGATIRKVVPEADAQKNLTQQRPYGSDPSIGGSVGVAGNTKGLTAPQIQDSLGLDYSQYDTTKDPHKKKNLNPYYTRQSDGTYSPANKVTVVQTPMTQEMVDEAKVPMDRTLREHAKAMADAGDPDAKKVYDNSFERNVERTKVNAGTPDEYERRNPWNPFAGTGATQTGRRRPDGEKTVNEELQMQNRKNLPVGARQIDIDERGNETVTGEVRERQNSTTGSTERYWQAVQERERTLPSGQKETYLDARDPTAPPSTRAPQALDDKVLYGRTKEPVPAGATATGKDQRTLVGGHSPQVANHPDYQFNNAVQNPDGTSQGELTANLGNGVTSKKKGTAGNPHTLAPKTWSDGDVLKAGDQTANSSAVATRARDGATLHQETINGVKWEVVKDRAGNVTSSYPTGGRSTNPTDFTNQ
jgi:regulator of protease activity HflC (stomatin/prohibitin superfamily)